MDPELSTDGSNSGYSTVSIPFENKRQAATALRVLVVDKIIRSDTVSRDLTVEDDSLIA